MAIAIPIAMLAVSVLGAVSAKNASDKQAKAAKEAGEEQQQYANFQATQLRAKANDTQASAQRQAIDQRKQAQLAISRATALAAASGGGAADPTVTNILGNLAGEGEYNALSTLYEGDTEAQGYRDQADETEQSGIFDAGAANQRASALSSAGTMTAIGSVAQGAGSFFSKYGGFSGGSTVPVTDTVNSGYGLGSGVNSSSGMFGSI